MSAMAWTIVLALGAAAALLLASLTLTRRKYQRLFSDDHFRELATGLSGLQPRTDGGDAPPHFVTSVGLAVAYAVVPLPEGVRHHVSMSYVHGALARAGAAPLIAFLADLGGVPLHRVVLFDTGSPVIHGEFGLTASEDAVWTVVPPGDAELSNRMKRAFGASGALIRRFETRRSG